MGNWPKDYIVVCRAHVYSSRAKRNPKEVDWRRFNGKRYTQDGALFAATVYSKRRGDLVFGAVPAENFHDVYLKGLRRHAKEQATSLIQNALDSVKANAYQT